MCKCTRKPNLVPGTVHSSIMNIISNRPTHPNIIFISTKIDPQNSTERGSCEDGPWELGLGEAKGCVAYIPPGAPFSPLCAHTAGKGDRQTEPSSRTPSQLQTPPNDASGVTSRSWHYTEMGLSPGPAGIPQPQELGGVIIIPGRKHRALTCQSALPMAQPQGCPQPHSQLSMGGRTPSAR